jgi:predicted DNA-binding transcriptional regulator AlpA
VFSTLSRSKEMPLPLLDTVAASRYMGLSKSTLEKWRVYGGGPKHYKYSKVVRYRQEDLDEWLSERLVSSTSETR